MITPAVLIEIVAQLQTPEAQYLAGVAARRDGRNSEAVSRFNQVLVAQPENVDARLNLGLSLLSLGELEEAEATFRVVLAAQPDYVDAEIGLARVAQRKGEPVQALDRAQRAQRLAPAREDVRALVSGLQPRVWRIDVGASRSTLSMDLPDWKEEYLAVSRRLSDDWSLGLAVERTERFSNVDVLTEARLDRTGSRGSAYVSVGGAPNADYRPEAVLRMGGERVLGQQFRGTLDTSAAHYGAGAVLSLQPGFGVRLFEDRFDLSARWINVRDEAGQYRSGYAVNTAWRLSSRVGLRAGYAAAPESSEGVTVDVQSRSLGLDLSVLEQTTLKATVVSEDRGAYERKELSVGLGWRF